MKGFHYRLNFRRPRTGVILALVLVLAGIWLLQGSRSIQQSPASPPAVTPAQAQIVRNFAGRPLSFEPCVEANCGGAQGAGRFVARGPGYSLRLSPAEATFALRVADVGLEKEEGSDSRNPFTFGPIAWRDEASSVWARHTAPFGPRQWADRSLTLAARTAPSAPRSSRSVPLRMKLVGANAAAQAVEEEQLPGRSNYFLGNDPAQWRTNVPNYSRVRYKDVYPGIDLVYYGNQGQLEHDFIVAPGADPTAIQLSFEGAEKVEVDGAGDLVLRAEGAETRLRRPVAYQEIAGLRHPIASGFLANSQGQAKFQVADYDASRPLVIDPVLLFSSYLGGTWLDEPIAVAVDSSGNVHVSGTAGRNFPTTPGAFQGSFQGGSSEDAWDVFVLKLGQADSQLIYSTYLGGQSGDFPWSMAVDAAGNTYVAGYTRSPNFPTTANAYQSQWGDAPDCAGLTSFCSNGFLAKLDSTGSRLLFSTFLGGRRGDGIEGFGVDGSGNLYVSGFTYSADFPTTPGALRTEFHGQVDTRHPVSDCFLAKLDSTGSRLLYSTYWLYCSLSTVDPSGNIYLPGLKFNPEGSALIYSNPIDCSSGCDMALDPSRNVYITTSSGSYNRDVFLIKLDPTGKRVFSFQFGGSTNAYPGAIAVDAFGRAYITGLTYSGFPTTVGAVQNEFKAGGICTRFGDPCPDSFIAVINPDGSSLAYSTYLGGIGYDSGRAITVDSRGNMYVSGSTASNDFPLVNAWQQTLAGATDIFVAKISRINPIPRAISLSPASATAGGAGFTLNVTGEDFLPGAVVRWNGSGRITTFVSNSELQAEIPANDIVPPGAAQVTVFNPGPGGGVSNTVAFPVLGPPRPPPPQVESLVPASAAAGGPAFTLTVRGTNFLDGTVVLWDSQQRPTTFVSSAQVQAAIPAGDIAQAEEARVSVWVPGVGFSSALPFRIEAAAPGSAPPVINAGGVANAAFSQQPAAAGGIASLFGQALAATTAAAHQLPLPSSLAGVTVRVNGIAAPLFSVSPAQINFLMPWELAGQAQATVTVTVNGVTSAPQTVALATYAPGIFAVSQTGSGQGTILIANTAALAAPVGMFAGARPARRGEFVSIYCTGLGPVSNPEAAGAPLAGSALSTTITLPMVTIGGVPARVSYAGLAPGWVGLYQVDAEVPAEAPAGNAVAVALAIGGAASNTVTIAVQ